MTSTKKALKTQLELTPAVEEGPYYTPGSPERKNIVGPGTPGAGLIIDGRVLDKKGQPISRAWLDFWHANGEGIYDNDGFNLRGHQLTSKDGRYHLETVRPIQYSSRTPHVHVKVRANDSSPVLTTQLYFPGEKRNKTDPIFQPGTLMDVKNASDGQKAIFDFVVEVA